MCGNEYVGFNNSVFLEDDEEADLVRSIAYLMRKNGCFPEGSDIRRVLEFYFQTMCVEMTCDSNAVLAATLANGGVCPLTVDKLMGEEAITNVLALMGSCGMSLYAGQFAFRVRKYRHSQSMHITHISPSQNGLPAISSDSGAVMIVIPGVMGICAWSPPLDKLGISERGLQFCQKISKKYAFHRRG